MASGSTYLATLQANGNGKPKARGCGRGRRPFAAPTVEQLKSNSIEALPAPEGFCRLNKEGSWLRLTDLVTFVLGHVWENEFASLTTRRTIQTVSIFSPAGVQLHLIRGDRAVELLQKLGLPSAELTLDLPDPRNKRNVGTHALEIDD
jgi:hypothetical protein